MNSSWTVTGWGIKEDAFYDEKITTENKVKFIKKFLPDVYKEMQEDLTEMERKESFANKKEKLEYTDCWIESYENACCDTGFGVLFAEAISQNEKDFTVTYCRGEYPDENSILYEDRLPWEMTERVKKMKAEDMTAIFNKYLDELQVSAIAERQSVEYYG